MVLKRKTRWMLKAEKAITAREAKLAAEVRLHERYAALERRIDVLQDKLATDVSFEREKQISSELCDLQIELQSVAARIAESDRT